MSQSEKTETRAGGGAAGEALAMLDAFAGVGALRFDVTFTDAAGGKVGFRPNRTLGQLRPAIPAILAEAEERRHNVIVRPRSAAATLIQLDDLGEVAAARLRPLSFLVLRTSPGNYQAWVAAADADADFVRRLRKGTGADLTASGATRISGSLNFKDKYAPGFPRVETVHACPGLVVTRVELEALGIAAQEQAPAPGCSSHRRHGKGWPSYQLCLDNAPQKRDGSGPDRSLADFTFCKIALDWGQTPEATAVRLLQESGKAREEGEKYALRTARRAAAAVVEPGERQR